MGISNLIMERIHNPKTKADIRLMEKVNHPETEADIRRAYRMWKLSRLLFYLRAPPAFRIEFKDWFKNQLAHHHVKKEKQLSTEAKSAILAAFHEWLDKIIADLTARKEAEEERKRSLQMGPLG